VSVTAADILGEDGPIAKALAARMGVAFESRPEQLQMAAAVSRAMEEKTHLLVEAGTGVGKSFAYLIPAIIRATLHNQTVLVATNTISLQEQLIERDIPLLIEALGLPTPPKKVEEEHPENEPRPAPPPATVATGPFAGARPLKAVLVKGRGNYVSIRRLKLASQRQDRLFGDAAARRSLHVIEDWANETLDGTLATLPQVERMGVWDKVQSDSGNCMGRSCPTYRTCFYQNARRELEGANLLVCNHALFFSDLALRAQEVGFLPKYDHVILDEAHNVEDVASDHFGVSLSEGRVNHLLGSLYQSRQGKGYLPHLELMNGEIEPVERAIHLVEQAGGASRTFFESVAGLLGEPRSAFGEARPGRGSGRIREAGAVANVLTPVMRDLSLRLKMLKEQAKNEQDKFELNSYAQRAEMIAASAEIVVSQKMPGYAYWVETGEHDDEGLGAGRFRRVTFACSPIEVAPILKERLFKQEHSTILTSATLATRTVNDEESSESGETAFAHLISRIGCEGAKTLQLGSPFDYARQVKFIVDRGAESPKARKDDEGFGSSRAGGSFAAKLSERILHHVRQTNGGAFVLFTSFSMLNACASELAGELAELGLPLLAQGRDGPRGLILQRFRENENSVLFGAASFWQGVDVRGRGLRNVIITKLPFEPPDRPLTEARAEMIEARGGSAFQEDSLPRAVIRFKQGFGRLIRSKEDTGRVVVLDPRIVTARYGKVFLRALPAGVEVVTAEE